MKNHLLRRVLSMLLVVALLAGYYVPSVQAANSGLTWKESDQKVTLDLTDRKAENHVEEKYAPTDVVRVSIVLEDKPTLQAGFTTRNIAKNASAMAYNRTLQAKQNAIATEISAQALGGKKLDVVWNLTLVGNLISANVPYGRIPAIAKVPGVRDVIVENTYAPCVVEREEVVNPQMFASLGMVGSSLVWSGGYTGAGTRIAVIDTGTDTDHQSLDPDAFLYSLERNAQEAGVDYDEYLDELNLLDTQEIASVLSYLNIYEADSSLTADKLYLNEKLPFAVNYIDKSNRRLVVDHESDDQGEHGSHVAGIATANRYIPSGDGGYEEALDKVLMAGMAPDAQLITMKVFGEEGAPTDADYLAAVEDAIYLGCDAVNLSLGSAMAGDSFTPYFSDLLDYMTKTDTVVVASAGNSYAWPEPALFGYLYTDDVNLDTVGSPGSYYSFFSVASVDNDGGMVDAFRLGGRTMGYNEHADGFASLASLDSSTNLTGTDYEYIFIDGIGNTEDYTGMDLSGKIVFCSRGSLNFADKANNAASLGAAATIIYNNEGGILNMSLAGYTYKNPCVSITKAVANAVRAASTKQTTSGGLTYYTGTMTVLGRPAGVINNSEYYTMSRFSSWGVPGDLSIKPEITAPGGNILSIFGKTPEDGGVDQYEVMSGTSMAAPAVTGMAALVAQYIRENEFDKQENLKVRTLAQSLLMSTAVPMVEENSGSYYSILKQGAGLARVDLATSADSYILVNGQSDGKVKAELGDDPNRTGVYKFSFSLNNLTDKAQTYALSADIFRQDAFEYQVGTGIYLLNTMTTSLPGTAAFSVNGTPVNPQRDMSQYDMNGDGKTNATDADYLLEYLLGNEANLYGEGDVSDDGTVNSYDAHVLLAMLSSGEGVNVPAGGSVTVDVCLTLTDSAKKLLDDNYANGTYVEAYVYAESISSDEGVAGTRHSIPVLAFYGNWSDPSMFDHGTVVGLLHDEADLIPYMYEEIGCGNALTISYGDGEEYIFGGNPVELDPSYHPERDAFNSEDASYLVGQYFTLIRGASDSYMMISNADTGEVYMKKQLGAHTPAFYYLNGGRWVDTQKGTNLNWSGTDASGKALPEGTNVEISLVAIPEYYRNDDGTHNYDKIGDGAYLTSKLTIDNTAPEVSDIVQNNATVTVFAQDNQYVAGVVLLNSTGSSVIATANANQQNAKEKVAVNLDLTNVSGENFLLLVSDYAMNTAVYQITLDLPELVRPYFTAVDYDTGTYYGLNADGTAMALATGNRGEIQAVEFVDGYVFEVSSGGNVFYASDDDLNSFYYLTKLDADYTYGVTSFLDLAYNYADSKLYGLFYADANSGAFPYLCTIDMHTGRWQVLCEMPVDVNNIAIDGDGNFYSTGYNSNNLYTYTLKDLAGETMKTVGQVGSYSTRSVNSLAWDHNTDTLYWAHPDALLKIDHTTGAPTLVSSFDYNLVGLYIRNENAGNQFVPTNKVDSVTIDYAENRVLVGHTITVNAMVMPWTVSDRSVTWSSANPSVATVDANGIVTGISAGKTTITAASKLDSTKSVSCTMYVEEMNKTMNAIVWDEVGQVWWSEFKPNALPAYTKLTTQSAAAPVAATAILNGTLYTATADTSTENFRSVLYTVDPESFQLTTVGLSSIGYTDIAPAPHIKGGSLAATYGKYILFVDISTGNYYSNAVFEPFADTVVGIAYAGYTPYQGYGFDTVIDWYYIVDVKGCIYMKGWMEQDGKLYYLDNPYCPEGVFTKTNITTEAPYYSSLYTDGDFVYYSCFDPQKNNSTLYAIDTVTNRKCYRLGNFGDGIWPASGLMELNTMTANADILNVTHTMKPQAAAASTEVAALSVTSAKVTEPKAIGGGLNAVTMTKLAGNMAPQSSGDFIKDTGKVTVTLTAANQQLGSTNGRMTVTYNAEELKLVSVTGTTAAFAYAAENGTVHVAYASADVMDGDAAVAVLTFEVLESGEHTISVLHTEDGNAHSDKEETLTVTTGCDHNYEAVVTEPTCQAQGYTTYTCSKCNDSYVADYTDPVDHSYANGECIWCGEYYVKWVAVNTLLTGSIDLNFFVVLADQLVNADTFVRFTCNGETLDVPLSEALVSVKDGATRYRFSYKVFAKEMTDVVTAQVMTPEGAVGEAMPYSVAEYCYGMINYTQNPEMAALCKAMLNYGTAAQNYFGYKLNNLANADLKDEERVVTDFDPSAYAYSRVGSEEGIKVSGAKLLLEADVAIQVSFSLTGSKPITDYTFTIDGVETSYSAYSNDKYYFEVSGIEASKFNKLHAFRVGGLTLNYSVLSYANQAYEQPAPSEKLIGLVNAMYAYHTAAYAYVN